MGSEGANVLVDKEGRLALADLGLSVQKSSVGTNDKNKPVCTLVYQSPEQLFGVERGFSEKSDMWSLGCILYELLTGRVFFHRAQSRDDMVSMVVKHFGADEFEGWDEVRATQAYRDKRHLIRKPKTVFNHLREEKIDPLAVDLLDKLCRLNPDKRLSAEEVLSHPFLAVPDEAAAGGFPRIPQECHTVLGAPRNDPRLEAAGRPPRVPNPSSETDLPKSTAPVQAVLGRRNAGDFTEPQFEDLPTSADPAAAKRTKVG